MDTYSLWLWSASHDWGFYHGIVLIKSGGIPVMTQCHEWQRSLDRLVVFELGRVGLR